MSAGKRHSTDDPLTEHDVADRLSKAMLRTWKILEEINGDPALHYAVKGSRYLAIHPDQLIDALQRFAREKHGYCAVCRDGGFADDGHTAISP